MSIRACLVLAVVVAASPARADDTDDTICTCDVTPAACDAGCACDSECTIDWSVDECSLPDSGCIPDAPDYDDATLASLEEADPGVDPPVEWPTSAADVACPDGASNQDGRCVADPHAAAGEVSGGCSTGALPGVWIGAAALALVWLVRRRRSLAVLGVIAACTVGGDSWDDAVDAGPTGDARYVDVYAAELNDAGAAQFLLANQALASGAHEPVAQFSLMRSGGTPVYRVAGSCGDQLATSGGDELLGWARASAGDGTGALVELVAPDGCTFAYETDQEAIDGLIAQGYTQTAVLGYVWPPGLAEPPVQEPTVDVMPAAVPACTINAHSPVELLYASPGADYTARFLLGCPGEVIVGEKREGGPVSRMTDPTLRAAGGRTAFVLDRNGDKLRALLMRTNGVERTAAYLRHKLQVGYDYIVIDEVTSAADYADGQTFNRRLRQLMLRMPARSIIPYISIDLTQELPSIYMQDRRLLLRSFEKRARVLALEVYLHTAQVMAGAAPGNFRRAADRIANAVHGLKGTAGINRHAITTIGTSMHSTYAQYRYLDQPSHDLASITRQVNAIRHGSGRLRQQHGVGWYFVNKSDMTPSSGYSYTSLIRRLRTQALRFR